MNLIVHKAETRGFADYGWLRTSHTFSFASYQNPKRVRFGLLRVLNDDIVQAGRGFKAHPHENMEIISIPLSGALAHKDSHNHEQIIYPDDVQIMSAGTGIKHSEYNHSNTEPVNFLQIWIFPKKKNIYPRYEQKKFNPDNRLNQWQNIVTPFESEDTLWINQDAYLSRMQIESNNKTNYSLNKTGNGLYLFVIEGQVVLNETILNRRDGVGISDFKSITLSSQKLSDILAIEVPM